MNQFIYSIPVEVGEAHFLLEALRCDLLLHGSFWVLTQDGCTGTISIKIATRTPLSLNDRRKIVSCGLSIQLSEVE